MTALSKNPTTNAVIVTGWTNPTYIYNEDGTQLGTAAPGKTVYVTSDYGGFDFSTIPDGVVINSFTIVCYAKASTGALTVLHLLWQPWSGGAAIGVEKDQASLTTSLASYSQTWALTLEQIKSADFKIRLRGYRTGNTAYTLSVDYVRVTVDYKFAVVIQDVIQAQTADNVTLTAHVPHFSLIIQDVAQGQGVENAILTSHEPSAQLIIQSVFQGQNVEVPGLTQHNILSISAATQSQSVDNVNITGHIPTFSLTIQDASQSQSAAQLGLIQHNVISIADATQGQSADTAGLIQHSILDIANASQSQGVGLPSLTQHNTLSIANSTQGQVGENVTLSYSPPGTATLMIQSVTQSQTVEGLGLTQHNIITIADAIQRQFSNAPELLQHNILTIADAVQGQVVEQVILIPYEPGKIVLMIDDVIQMQLSDEITVAYHRPGINPELTTTTLSGMAKGLQKGMEED